MPYLSLVTLLVRDYDEAIAFYVDTLSVVEPFQRDNLEVLSILATLAAVAIEETKLREDVAREQRIRDKLARYSSSSVVNHIIEAQKDAKDPIPGPAWQHVPADPEAGPGQPARDNRPAAARSGYCNGS